MLTLSFIQQRSRLLALATVIGFALVIAAALPAVADANYSQGSYSSSHSSSSNASFMCRVISQSLSIGSRDASTGNQVSALQSFLAQDRSIYPEGEVTGYFGPQTQKAVQRFQQHYGIVSSGTPDTTGYGSVGARTRAVIESLCEKSDIDEGEDEEESDENDIDSIDEIIVYLDKATKRAEVQVIINRAPDLAFAHTYVSQAKAITFIGEKLENSYGFDFDEFSTDRKRDAQLKRLIEWEYEDEDEDEDTLTLEDIRRITVTSSDDEYADVVVDLRDDDDLIFDVADDTESKLVRVIANKLENSYDFDFDEYNSDRKRDSDVKKLIDWEEDEVVVSGTLDIKAVMYGGCAMGGSCSSYTLDGRTYSYTKGLIATCMSLDCKDTVTKQGTLSASLYNELVNELTAATLTSNSKPRTATCSSYVDGIDYTYKITKEGTLYTLDTCGSAFGDNASLKTLLAKTWTEMEKGTVVTTKGAYGLTDVKTVTAKSVDPIKGAIDDEYILYTITLKSGTKHEVKVNGMVPAEFVEKSFRATGYTGVIKDLMALAIKETEAVPFGFIVKATSNNAAKASFSLSTPCVSFKLSWGDNVAESRQAQSKSQVCAMVIDNVEVTHTYEKAGTYTVTLTVGNKTATQKVTVSKVATATYGLSDVKSVTSKQVDPIQNAADDEYTLYTITLNDGTKHEVKVGFTTVENRNKRFADTGYTGDVAKLMALAKAVTTDATMCLSDGVWYKEGTEKTKIVNSDGTSQGIADGVFRCVKGKWTTKGSDWGPQKTTPFSIKDIKDVITKFIDPTPSSSYMNKSGDEYTQYMLTLKDGSKRSVNVDFGSYAGVVDQFEEIGFTGSVWDITIMGAKGYGN